MFAVMSGSSEAVELLLQYGADPNLRNSKDRTARDIAALTGIKSFLDYLFTLII